MKCNRASLPLYDISNDESPSDTLAWMRVPERERLGSENSPSEDETLGLGNRNERIKEKADTEIQYQPHIVDTLQTLIADGVFADPVYETPTQ